MDLSTTVIATLLELSQIALNAVASTVIYHGLLLKTTIVSK